ncbi:hypothetical protein [Streptomyces narbonensis]|uniref:hypothetical protein n=1 Tax=Streptomyces narbonensis TaxID=67333 RepID=UPI0033F7CF4C
MLELVGTSRVFAAELSPCGPCRYRIGGLGKQDTSIKTTQAVRDRLRVLAAERGVSMHRVLEDLVNRELTMAEKEERARIAMEEIRHATGVTLSEEAQAEARAFLRKLGGDRPSGHWGRE